MLKRFFCLDCLEKDYAFTDSGTYFIPDLNTLEEYWNFTDQIPGTEDPEIFGLNQNANIIYLWQESLNIVNTILDIQPWVSSAGTGEKSSDEIIQELVKTLEEQCPLNLDIFGDHKKDLFKLNNGLMHCLSTVLL